MIYACDTHALVWFLSGDHRRLGAKALRALERATQGRADVRLSVATLFEVALLLQHGRLRSALAWPDWVEAVRSKLGFGIEPVTLDDVAHARSLVGLVDPFDRLIVGTAVRLGASLITSDDRIAAAGVVGVTW